MNFLVLSSLTPFIVSLLVRLLSDAKLFHLSLAYLVRLVILTPFITCVLIVPLCPLCLAELRRPTDTAFITCLHRATSCVRLAADYSVRLSWKHTAC